MFAILSIIFALMLVVNESHKLYTEEEALLQDQLLSILRQSMPLTNITWTCSEWIPLCVRDPLPVDPMVFWGMSVFLVVLMSAILGLAILVFFKLLDFVLGHLQIHAEEQRRRIDAQEMAEVAVAAQVHQAQLLQEQEQRLKDQDRRLEEQERLVAELKQRLEDHSNREQAPVLAPVPSPMALPPVPLPADVPPSAPEFSHQIYERTFDLKWNNVPKDCFVVVAQSLPLFQTQVSLGGCPGSVTFPIREYNPKAEFEVRVYPPVHREGGAIFRGTPFRITEAMVHAPRPVRRGTGSKSTT